VKLSGKIIPIDRSALIAASSLIWEGGLRRDIVSPAAKPNLPWMTKMMMAMRKSDKRNIERRNLQFETNLNDQRQKSNNLVSDFPFWF
jgi:hypothetical protein